MLLHLPPPNHSGEPTVGGPFGKERFQGQPIGGRIVDAVRSEQAAARCVFGALVATGLDRHWPIEIRTAPEASQQATEILRAPSA